MSLHDIDRTHGRRLNPSPNSNDKVADRQAAGTTQNHNAGEEALSDGLKLKERQIIAVQDGFNKAVFGFFGEANKFGFKVAQDGFDVLTANDDELIFNSEQNMFKIIQSGTATLPADASGPPYVSSVTVNHNLGYIPVVKAYAGTLGVSLELPFIEFNSGTGVITEVYTVGFITTTTINFVHTDLVDPTTDIGIKYYLMQETAAV